MKILNVVGARPNFVKIAPLHRAFLQHADMCPRIVHTGQHQDFAMSGIFFRELDIPEPHYFLRAGGGSSTTQTAEMIAGFEKVITRESPDLVVVVGDVTSTLACALTAAQMRVPLAHVEAGLRSGDRTMPEELNRILTDALSDDLFVTEQSGVANLLAENVQPARIHLVGNIMIDSLVHVLDRTHRPGFLTDLGVASGQYLVVTMHRPGNVDQEEGLETVMEMLRMLGNKWKVVFVMHPRTKRNIRLNCLGHRFGKIRNLQVLPPLGYIPFLTLLRNAAAVVTDSGGVQEETTFLGIPCITLRNSTERPATVEHGTNRLLPHFDAQKVWAAVNEVASSGRPQGSVPPLWDGNASQRIVNILREKYINS